MTRTSILAGGALAAALLAAAAVSTAATHSTAPTHAQVIVHTSSLGRHLTDSRGRTLYVFTRDIGHRSSTCKGACAQNWPPLRSRSAVHGGRGVSAAHLRRIHRSDGAQQVTYFGRPLYEFAGDSGPNQTHGQRLDAFGGHWYIVSPTGRAITKSASSMPAPGEPKNIPPSY